jgi:chromosome partitioning protein
MQVIAVLNQKRVRKTTIATHLARALQLDGASVLLVDSDPQGSARDWAAVRDDNRVTVVGIDRPTIDRDLKNVASKDFVVIDGAPQAATWPCRPSRPRFRADPVQPALRHLGDGRPCGAGEAAHRGHGRKLQAAFVVSRAIKGTALAAEVTEALAGYGLPVLESRITQRVSYPGTAAAGTTILDAEPDGDGAEEIRALMNEIKQKLI